MLPPLTSSSAEDLVEKHVNVIDVITPVKVKTFSWKQAAWRIAASVTVQRRDPCKAELN